MSTRHCARSQFQFLLQANYEALLPLLLLLSCSSPGYAALVLVAKPTAVRHLTNIPLICYTWQAATRPWAAAWQRMALALCTCVCVCAMSPVCPLCSCSSSCTSPLWRPCAGAHPWRPLLVLIVVLLLLWPCFLLFHLAALLTPLPLPFHYLHPGSLFCFYYVVAFLFVRCL